MIAFSISRAISNLNLLLIYWLTYWFKAVMAVGINSFQIMFLSSKVRDLSRHMLIHGRDATEKVKKNLKRQNIHICKNMYVKKIQPQI